VQQLLLARTSALDYFSAFGASWLRYAMLDVPALSAADFGIGGLRPEVSRQQTVYYKGYDHRRKNQRYCKGGIVAEEIDESISYLIKKPLHRSLGRENVKSHHKTDRPKDATDSQRNRCSPKPVHQINPLH
jgi:hypothetical protein